MKYDFDEVGKSVGKSISKLFERYGKEFITVAGYSCGTTDSI